MSVRSIAVIGVFTVTGVLTAGVLPAGAANAKPLTVRSQVRHVHAAGSGRNRGVHPDCITCIEIDRA